MYHIFSHYFNLSVTLLTIIKNHNMFQVTLKRLIQLIVCMNADKVRLQFMDDCPRPDASYQ